MGNKISGYKARKGLGLPQLPYDFAEAKRDPEVLAWTEAFRGIPHYWTSEAQDLADNLRNRSCVRNGSNSGSGVTLDVRQLYAIAQRIDQLSRALVQAESISAGVHVLNADDLAEYERAQAEAEARALKSGVLVMDAETEEAALYDGRGDLVCRDSISGVEEHVLDHQFVVQRFDAAGFYPKNGFPDTLREWNDYYASARIQRAAAKRGL